MFLVNVCAKAYKNKGEKDLTESMEYENKTVTIFYVNKVITDFLYIVLYWKLIYH